MVEFPAVDADTRPGVFRGHADAGLSTLRRRRAGEQRPHEQDDTAQPNWRTSRIRRHGSRLPDHVGRSLPVPRHLIRGPRDSQKECPRRHCVLRSRPGIRRWHYRVPRRVWRWTGTASPTARIYRRFRHFTPRRCPSRDPLARPPDLLRDRERHGGLADRPGRARTRPHHRQVPRRNRRMAALSVHQLRWNHRPIIVAAHRHHRLHPRWTHRRQLQIHPRHRKHHRLDPPVSDSAADAR